MTCASSVCRNTTVDKAKKSRLEGKGWKFGPAEEFLGLAPEDAAYIELKLALGEKLKARRLSKHLTQAELAKIVKSSQSRVARMEAGDPTVTIDLLVKSLLALGLSPREIGRAIS